MPGVAPRSGRQVGADARRPGSHLRAAAVSQGLGGPASSGAVITRTDAEASLKTALAQFCTGVALITGMHGRRPAGFTAQSFVSVSLDPPLVSLCPSKASESWPLIRGARQFCVNILSELQRDLCARFARKDVDRFDGVEWRRGANGAPLIEGARAWLECRIEAEHEAGDHDIVLGRVLSFSCAEAGSAAPLIFYGRRFGRFAELQTKA